MTYGVGNPGPALGQAKKGGCVKSVNGMPILPLLMIGSPTAIQFKNQNREFKFQHTLHFALIHENWYKWINIQYVQT